MAETENLGIERLARRLRRRGFATPAMMMIDVLAPLGFVGEQMVVAFGPLLPTREWRQDVDGILVALRDQASRDLLHRLLED